MVKVLVVEDHPDFCKLVGLRIMNEFNVEVVEVDSGRAAALALESGHFDVVVSDYEMPNGNGEWLHQYLKKKFPMVPLIIFTGNLDYEPPACDHVLKAIVRKPGFSELLKEIGEIGGFNANRRP